jgi:hypothetical protein
VTSGYDPEHPIRDERGRLLDVGPGATEAEIASAIARRDDEDARNLDALRRLGRLGNRW